MTTAKYRYQLTDIGLRPFIIIWDEGVDRSCRTVTKEIDQVVDEICTKEKISPVDYFIIYRDRRGIWDGYTFATGLFVELRASTWMQAANMILKQQTD